MSKQIDLRVKGGWKQVRNAGSETCDRCGARLWIAPHGGVYCDQTHEGKPDPVAAAK